MKKILFLLCLSMFSTLSIYAQTNFKYLPKEPKAGDLITVIYVPPNEFSDSPKKLQGVYYLRGGTTDIDDLKFTKSGNHYITKVQTDTSNTMVYFGFFKEGVGTDNNNNNGYYILLNGANGHAKKGSYEALSKFYSNNNFVNVDVDYKKALTAISTEMKSFPDNRDRYLAQYANDLTKVKTDSATKIIENEIKKLLKRGLQTEDDYQLIESLYQSIKLNASVDSIASIKKEKFPDGKWKVNDLIGKLLGEIDPVKAAAYSQEVIQNIKTNPLWKEKTSDMGFYQIWPLYVYYHNNDLEGFKRNLPLYADAQTPNFYFLKNAVAKALIMKDTNLDFAEKLNQEARDWNNIEMNNPNAVKPKNLNTKNWREGFNRAKALFDDTYASLLFQKGKFKNAYQIEKEVIKIVKENEPDFVDNYARIAEKVLSENEYKMEMERLVKAGKATPNMIEGLKRIYVNEKRGKKGFDDYISVLKKDSDLKRQEALRKSMVDEPVPDFTLFDLHGNKVSVNELKGKTIVLDFWATWCGPCKASFPAMQTMVNKYKDDPSVKFLFIDTYEHGDKKVKNAADFIAQNKYPFQVLMDNDNVVAAQLKVTGIPAKFVIDQNGKVRFKATGFNSNEELLKELEAMISLAKEAIGKSPK